MQAWLELFDAVLRARHGLGPQEAAVGLLDLVRLRLALIDPDRIEYAASVAKIGIPLAWFDQHPEAATHLDPATRHELGMMIKASSNAAAMSFSRALGLAAIQAALHRLGFYDREHGGGLWVGKHYGESGERRGDPSADHAHAATVRQVLRVYLLLEQGRLLSASASQAMKDVFASRDIPPYPIKFARALAGRGLDIVRKWGTWEAWHHDSAIVRGSDRHEILVALTRQSQGDAHPEDLARGVEEAMQGRLEAGGSAVKAG